MKMPKHGFLAASIIFGIIGLVQAARYGSIFGATSNSLLILFLPAAAFAVAHASRKSMGKTAGAVLAIIGCTASVAIWSLFTIATEWLVTNTSAVTSISKYEQMLDRWDADFVSHFPRPIPPYAGDVRFSYRPRFLQGGTHIQLRVTAPPEKVAEICASFEARRTKSFLGGDWAEHANMKDGMPTTHFYTSGSKHELSFPDDYEVMIFDEPPKQPMSWNHGDSHGVAISKKRNTVVYWAESW